MPRKALEPQVPGEVNALDMFDELFTIGDIVVLSEVNNGKLGLSAGRVTHIRSNGYDYYSIRLQWLNRAPVIGTKTMPEFSWAHGDHRRFKRFVA